MMLQKGAVVMKKGIKIFAVLLCVILVAAASVTVWQWKNIKSVLIGINENPEKISERMKENKENLTKEINNYIDGEIRDMTPEEKQQIADGNATAEEIYEKIYQEFHEKTKNQKNGEKNSEDSKTSQNSSGDSEKTDDTKQTADSNKQEDTDEKTSSSKDEIVSKYVAQLYSLQGKYTAQAESTIAAAKSYYKEQRRAKVDHATAKAAVIKNYASIARSVQSQCDGEVAGVIANLESELKAIGENTDIVRTIKSAYENEKQLKISYFSGQYLN